MSVIIPAQGDIHLV